jgi:hypothetical protein
VRPFVPKELALNSIRPIAVALFAAGWLGCAAPSASTLTDRTNYQYDDPTFDLGREIADETAVLLTEAQGALQKKDASKAKSLLGRAEARLESPAIRVDSRYESLGQLSDKLSAQLAQVQREQAAPAVVAAPPAQPEVGPVAKASPPPPPPKAQDLAKQVQEAMDAMVATRAGLHGHELAQADVDRAVKARDGLTESVKNLSAADGKNPAHEELTGKAGEMLESVKEDIELGQLIANFVEGPAAAQKKALNLLSEANAETDNAKRKSALTDAREAFLSCASESQKMLAESPVLNRTALYVDTNRTSPKKVAAACATQAKALDKKLGKLAARKAGKPIARR